MEGGVLDSRGVGGCGAEVLAGIWDHRRVAGHSWLGGLRGIRNLGLGDRCLSLASKCGVRFKCFLPGAFAFWARWSGWSADRQDVGAWRLVLSVVWGTGLGTDAPKFCTPGRIW